MKKLLSIVLSVALTSFTANAGSFLLNEYNLVTIGDFQTSSDVEGKAFVGGNLNGQNSTFGSQLTQNANIDALTVAGSVNTATSVQQNNLVVGQSNTVTKPSVNQFKVNGNFINNVTDVSVEPTLDSIRADYKEQLESASQSFAQLDANSQFISQNNGKRKFKVDGDLAKDDYAVFSIDGNTSIFDNSSNPEIKVLRNNVSLSDIAGIIINVSGKVLQLSSSSNMVGNLVKNNYRKKVIWNFYEAEDIFLNSQNFMGTLLAPYATVTTAGNIDGAVGVFSLLTTAEVHLPTSKVKTPPPVKVPEPAPLLFIALAMVGLFAKRKVLKV